VVEQLQKRFTIPVELAMRYQNPSIESAVRHLKGHGVKELLLIAMFPHYAMSSYETAVERVKQVVRRMAPEMELKIVPPYFAEPGYIDALVAVAKPFLMDRCTIICCSAFTACRSGICTSPIPLVIAWRQRIVARLRVRLTPHVIAHNASRR
jgi:protoheme ferro-lyase